jgi:hypothetical protein
MESPQKTRLPHIKKLILRNARPAAMNRLPGRPQRSMLPIAAAGIPVPDVDFDAH